MITLADVQQAAARIQGRVIRTPSLFSDTLSRVTGAIVTLKLENLQATGAFKERGAANRLAMLSAAERQAGVIAMSAGNHAQAVARHASLLGITAVIVMPKHTPSTKVTRTAGWGARVVLHGDTLAEAAEHAHALAAAEGLVFVHPYDDPAVMAGQGTLALELLEDAPDLDMLVIPVGGGGLASGMGTAARAIKPGIGLIGVEAELFPSMYNRLKGTDLPCGGDTLAEGIAVKEPGVFTSKVLAGLLDDIVLVNEAALESAVALLLQIEKTVVEGAGAAGLAAMLSYPEMFKGRKVGVVLCGGNIDTRLLANVLLRDLARSGRLARLRLTLQDRPGALFKVMREFDAHQVNIIEIYHQRIFTHLPAKGLITDIECEARDKAQLDALVASLRENGYQVSQVELDR